MVLSRIDHTPLHALRRWIEEDPTGNGRSQSLHWIYINGSTSLLDGFKMLLIATETKDPGMIPRSTRSSKRTVENERWRRELVALSQKYSINSIRTPGSLRLRVSVSLSQKHFSVIAFIESKNGERRPCVVELSVLASLSHSVFRSQNLKIDAFDSKTL
jgi:hypothetical protein